MKENSSTLRQSQSLPNLNKLTHLTPEQFHQYFIRLMETTSKSQYQLVQLMPLMQSRLSNPDLTQIEKNSLVHSFRHLLENNTQQIHILVIYWSYRFQELQTTQTSTLILGQVNRLLTALLTSISPHT